MSVISETSVKHYARIAAAAVIALIALSLMISALVLLAVWLLLQSEQVALTPILGEAGASAVTGVTALGIVGLIIWVIWPPEKSNSKPSANIGAEAEAKLRSIVQEHPLESVSSAFAAGLAAGLNPDTRALLIKTLITLLDQKPTNAD